MAKRALSRRVNPRVVSSTSAAKNFGALVERVRTERAEYIVEKAGVPVARISPAATSLCSMADLVDLLRHLGPPDPLYVAAVKKGIAALNKPAIPENRWER